MPSVMRVQSDGLAALQRSQHTASMSYELGPVSHLCASSTGPQPITCRMTVK